MVLTTDLGNITISNDVIAAVAGVTATKCFGVKGMTAKSMADGIVRLLRRDHMNRGVVITESDDPLSHSLRLELHIAVNHGVNIPAVCRSIVSEVKYHTERLTGVHIEAVDICVDSIKTN